MASFEGISPKMHLEDGLTGKNLWVALEIASEVYGREEEANFVSSTLDHLVKKHPFLLANEVDITSSVFAIYNYSQQQLLQCLSFWDRFSSPNMQRGTVNEKLMDAMCQAYQLLMSYVARDQMSA